MAKATRKSMEPQIEQLYTQIFDALVKRELPVKRLKKSVGHVGNHARIVLDLKGLSHQGQHAPSFEIREMRGGGYYNSGGLGRLHATVARGYRRQTKQFRSKSGVFPIDAYIDTIEAEFRRGIEEFNNENTSETAMQRVRKLVKKVLGVDLDDFNTRRESPVEASSADGFDFRVELNLNPRQLAHVAAQLDDDEAVRFTIHTDESRLNRIINALGAAK